MDRSRKANREATEATLQHQSPTEALGAAELTAQKLTLLQAFVEQLRRTPVGSAELERRVKSFGKCERIEGETTDQFYAKLRRWLDRDMPNTRVPRHSPRQSDD